MKAVNLDLGCGRKKREGYVGIDVASSSRADLLADLRRGIPLHGDSCERVLCDNLLEHMPDLVGIMNEIWRVCRDGALVEVIVPYYTSIGAFQDPTHVRYFTEKTFLYFTQTLPYDYGFRGKFTIESVTLDPNPEFAREVGGVPFDIARKYFMNAVNNMIAILKAVK